MTVVELWRGDEIRGGGKQDYYDGIAARRGAIKCLHEAQVASRVFARERLQTTSNFVITAQPIHTALRQDSYAKLGNSD